MRKKFLITKAEFIKKEVFYMLEARVFVSNFSPYRYDGAENFTGYLGGEEINHYSGSYDEVLNALIVHEGWQEGYDY
jgi:hypothetical protein